MDKTMAGGALGGIQPEAAAALHSQHMAKAADLRARLDRQQSAVNHHLQNRVAEHGAKAQPAEAVSNRLVCAMLP